MSERQQFVLLAQYNKLMNKRMLEATVLLPAETLAADRGAFFKSVIGTLNHIMVGDLLWLRRFDTHSSGHKALQALADFPKPERLDEILYTDVHIFRDKRSLLDEIILAWCSELQQRDLDTPLAYTNSKGVTHHKRLGDLVLHLFLHQVHHRGQITTLLSQEGVDFGDTDLPEIIPDVPMA